MKKLKQAGYLRQDVDNNDRRRHVLRLTEAGREVYADLVPRVRAAEAKMLEGVSADEYDLLLRLMARIRGNAEASG